MLDEMILSTIDQIHDEEGFAEAAVTLKLIDCYEKAFDIINECDQVDMACYDIFSESFIQEGETWESIKDAGRKAKESAKGKEDESKLKKLLLAIPRMIITFINQLIKNLKQQISDYTDDKKKKAVEDARKIAAFAHESTDKFEEVVEKYADKWRDQGVEISRKGIMLPVIKESEIDTMLNEYEKFVKDVKEGKRPVIGPTLKKYINLYDSKTTTESYVDNVNDDTYVEYNHADTYGWHSAPGYGLSASYVNGYMSTTVHDYEAERKRNIDKNRAKILAYLDKKEVGWDNLSLLAEKANKTGNQKYVKRLEKIRTEAEAILKHGIDPESYYKLAEDNLIQSYITKCNIILMIIINGAIPVTGGTLYTIAATTAVGPGALLLLIPIGLIALIHSIAAKILAKKPVGESSKDSMMAAKEAEQMSKNYKKKK